MRGVVLSDGVTTIDMRGPRIGRIYCYDWNQLLGRGPHVGTTQQIPDFDGVEVGPHSRSGLLAVMKIRLDGSVDAHGAAVAGGPLAWRDNYLDSLDVLYGLIDQTVPLDVTVHDDVQYTGQLIVRDPDRPSGIGHSAELFVSVLVAGGSLTRAAGS